MMVFRIIVGLLGLIAVLTGANDFLKGAAVEGDFGKNLGELVEDPTLNFTLRFLGAIWMGFGCLLLLFVSDLPRYKMALLISFVIVVVGGIGRLITIFKLGIEPGNEVMAYSILAVELLLVPTLIIWLAYNYITIL